MTVHDDELTKRIYETVKPFLKGFPPPYHSDFLPISCLLHSSLDFPLILNTGKSNRRAPRPGFATSQVRIVRRVIDSDEYDAAVRRSPAACPLFALGDERRRATRRGCRVGGVRGKRLRERAGRAV